MNKILKYILTGAGLFVLTNGSTNLEEQVLDETFSSIVSEKDAANGLIAPVYALLPTIYQHTTYFALQQIS